jgi:Kef-type K+ transport system membrane component KefB
VSDLALAAVLGAGILVASTISVEIGLSVALVELAAGVAFGNVFDVAVPNWLSFIGSFAGIVLTFLAGAEVDVLSSGASGKRASRSAASPSSRRSW